LSAEVRGTDRLFHRLSGEGAGDPEIVESLHGKRAHVLRSHHVAEYLLAMAETVHLYLKANGANVDGESTQVSLGRENSIECLSFEDSVRTAREAGSGMASGRRTYEPVRIQKRIDKSSPLIARALCNNEVIEGVFKFFRPNPTGDGTTEQFFTVKIRDGRVASVRRTSPDVIDPASAFAPPTEEVTFVFHTISWTYENGGVEWEDSWSDQR
jgi:type VI secretion system secreted protein Hcp